VPRAVHALGLAPEHQALQLLGVLLQVHVRLAPRELELAQVVADVGVVQPRVREQQPVGPQHAPDLVQRRVVAAAMCSSEPQETTTSKWSSGNGSWFASAGWNSSPSGRRSSGSWFARAISSRRS
jgi:hypothetical protein